MDYLACGHPDVSYHGVKAWVPQFESFRRQLGVMYCGAYGTHPDGTKDDYLFVAYNMHWEPHEFALPNLPRGMEWRIVIDSSDDASGCIYTPEQERQMPEQKKYMVGARTIIVCIGRPAPETPADKQSARAASQKKKNAEKTASEGEQQTCTHLTT